MPQTAEDGWLDELALGRRLIGERLFQLERTVLSFKSNSSERLLGALRGAIRQCPGRVFSLHQLAWAFGGWSVSLSQVAAAPQHL